MAFVRLCLGVALAVSLSKPLIAQERALWTEYRNERFGFSLRYPADIFEVESRSEAGDGQGFRSKDGAASLLVGVLRNTDGHTPKSYLQYIAQRSYAAFTVGYHRLQNSWFAVSGENADTIFYEKAILSCRGALITSFALLYPKVQRGTFDLIVERMEDSFRSGAVCQAQDRAEVREEAGHRVSSQFSADDRAGGTRSPLADRIARQRGRDVIVILRRTTPPFDRQIVRGYAGR